MKHDLEDMRLFYETARAGGVSAAARSLCLPKSTLSRRLANYESQLGVQLFHKTTRRFSLTVIGEGYFARCARVVEEMNGAKSYLDSLRTDAQGRLRVTMTTEMAVYWLSDFLAAYVQKHPKVRLELDFTPRAIDLIDERIDVALRVGALKDSDLIAKRLFGIRRFLVASPDWIERHGEPKRPSDLSDGDFVLLEAHAASGKTIKLTNGHAEELVPYDGAILSNSLGALKALVLSGAGIGVLPERMCKDDLRANRLSRVLPRWRLSDWDVYYVVLTRKLMPVQTRLFVDALGEWFSPSQGRGSIRA